MMGTKNVKISKEQEVRDNELNVLMSDIQKLFEGKKCTMGEIEWMLNTISSSVNLVQRNAICKVFGAESMSKIEYGTLSKTIE